MPASGQPHFWAPELNTTFPTLARLISATMRGLVIMAPSDDDSAQHRVWAAPFGASSDGEWSEPALGVASLFMGFLEPDPEVD